MGPGGGPCALTPHPLHRPEFPITLDVGDGHDDHGHDHRQDRHQQAYEDLSDHGCSSCPGGRPIGSSSSGAKYRKRPWARCRSAIGSATGVTATWTWPSTSCRTASTKASRPTRNRSWASARRAPGRIRTLLPRPTMTPSITTSSVSGDTELSEPG